MLFKINLQNMTQQTKRKYCRKSRCMSIKIITVVESVHLVKGYFLVLVVVKDGHEAIHVFVRNTPSFACQDDSLHLFLS